jgi:hypothetical protein
MEPCLRPDCRRIVCDLCRRVVYLCSWCDRGQRYCSENCSGEARQRSLRAAGRRYQRTRRGRRCHARRQAEYRLRRRSGSEKVTHQGCPVEKGSGRVRTCEPTRSTLAPASAFSRSPLPAPFLTAELLCFVCGAACEAFVREDFLRCRRGRGPSTRSPGNDFAGGVGRDPPFVHR